MNRKKCILAAAMAALLVGVGGAPLFAAASPQPLQVVDPIAAQTVAEKARIAKQDAAAEAELKRIAADATKAAAATKAKAKGNADEVKKQIALAQQQRAIATRAIKASKMAKMAGKPANCVTVLNDGAIVEAPEGIFADPEAPASGSVFLGSNRWSGELDNGTCVRVWVGVDGSNPDVGMLLIGTSTSTEMLPSVVRLAGSGALRVTAAQGTRLSLAQVNGKKTYVFDVQTKTWK